MNKIPLNWQKNCYLITKIVSFLQETYEFESKTKNSYTNGKYENKLNRKKLLFKFFISYYIFK